MVNFSQDTIFLIFKFQSTLFLPILPITQQKYYLMAFQIRSVRILPNTLFTVLPLLVMSQDCSRMSDSMSNADSIFFADVSSMPSSTIAYRGGQTVTLTGSAALTVRVRNQAFDEITPVECFTGLVWELVEEGAQPMTTAYGGSPFTFSSTTHQPTQFEIADMGNTVPCGSYTFNLKVTETNSGITNTGMDTITINYLNGTENDCGAIDVTSISSINADPDSKWLPADIGVVGISRTNAIPFVFDNGSPIVPKVYDSSGNELTDLSCFCTAWSLQEQIQTDLIADNGGTNPISFDDDSSPTQLNFADLIASVNDGRQAYYQLYFTEQISNVQGSINMYFEVVFAPCTLVEIATLIGSITPVITAVQTDSPTVELTLAYSGTHYTYSSITSDNCSNPFASIELTALSDVTLSATITDLEFTFDNRLGNSQLKFKYNQFDITPKTASSCTTISSEMLTGQIYQNWRLKASPLTANIVNLDNALLDREAMWFTYPATTTLTINSVQEELIFGHIVKYDVQDAYDQHIIGDYSLLDYLLPADTLVITERDNNCQTLVDPNQTGFQWDLNEDSPQSMTNAISAAGLDAIKYRAYSTNYFTFPETTSTLTEHEWPSRIVYPDITATPLTTLAAGYYPFNLKVQNSSGLGAQLKFYVRFIDSATNDICPSSISKLRVQLWESIGSVYWPKQLRNSFLGTVQADTALTFSYTSPIVTAYDEYLTPFTPECYTSFIYTPGYNIPCTITETTSGTTMTSQYTSGAPITIAEDPYTNQHSITVTNLEALVIPGTYNFRITCTESRSGQVGEVDTTITVAPCNEATSMTLDTIETSFYAGNVGQNDYIQYLKSDESAVIAVSQDPSEVPASCLNLEWSVFGLTTNFGNKVYLDSTTAPTRIIIDDLERAFATGTYDLYLQVTHTPKTSHSQPGAQIIMQLPFELTVILNCPQVSSLTILQQVEDISLPFLGIKDDIELNDGKALSVDAYDKERVTIWAGCTNFNWNITAEDYMLDTYGSNPLSLDSNIAPKNIEVKDLQGLVPAGSYTFTISVQDASSTTATGEANFEVHVEPDFSHLIATLIDEPYFMNLDQSNQMIQLDLQDSDTSATYDLGNLVYAGQVEAIYDSNNPDFIDLQISENNYQLEVDMQEADAGINTVKIDIQNLDDGTLVKTIEIQVALVEDDQNHDQTKVIDVFEEEEKLIAKEEINEQEVPEEIIQHNLNIKKPWVVKIKPGGNFNLNFTPNRLIDYQGQRSRARQLEQDQYISKEDGHVLQLVEGTKYYADQMGFIERIYGNQSNEEPLEGVHIYVQPGEMSAEEKLNFSFTTSDFDNEKLGVQLAFDNPAYVSSIQDSGDTLCIELDHLRDKSDKLIVEEYKVCRQLPNQMDSEEAMMITSLAGSTKSAVGTNFSVNSVLTYILGFGLGSMLGSFWILQLINHLVLFDVIVPANAQIFYGALADILAFDPIAVADSIFEFFHFDQTGLEEMSDKFAQQGYESPYVLKNFGSLLIITLIQILYILSLSTVYMGHRMLKCSSTGRVYVWIQNKLNGIFFNGIFIFIDGTFFIMILMTMINIRSTTQGKVGYNFNFYTAVFIFSTYVIQIIIIAVVLIFYQKRLEEEKFVQRIGHVYEALNYKIRGRRVLFYPIFNKIRFISLVAAILYLQGFVVFQVLVLSLSTTFLLAILREHVYSEPEKNKAEIVTEFIILLTIDLLLFASDPSNTVESQAMTGYLLIGILLGTIVYSQGIKTFTNIRYGIKKCKLHKSRKIVKRIQLERQQSLREAIKLRMELQKAEIDERHKQMMIDLGKAQTASSNMFQKPPLQADSNASESNEYNKTVRELNALVMPQQEVDEQVHKDKKFDQVKEDAKVEAVYKLKKECNLCELSKSNGLGPCALCELDKQNFSIHDISVEVEKIVSTDPSPGLRMTIEEQKEIQKVDSSFYMSESD